MAYEISTLSAEAFTSLTTQPTDAQCGDIARLMLAAWNSPSAFHEETGWPDSETELAPVVRRLITRTDWYADFTQAQAQAWDHSILQISSNAYSDLKFDSIEMFESLDWDCINKCAEFGCQLVSEANFGNRGFRNGSKLVDGSPHAPEYSVYLPAEIAELRSELEAVADRFHQLDDKEIREEFFDGLFATVKKAVRDNLAIWVVTDC